MMSNILEKTFGQIFSTADSYVGLQGLFRQCIAVKTKQEEALIINHYLNMLRERLKEPGIRPNFVGHCLAFAIFSELLGYHAEFCHIHAINLAQQATLPEKKMGYAASCCFLREGHELSLLLVNTLVRDLASSNVVVLGLALCVLCSAPIPAEAIPSLLPSVRDRLGHAKAYVRSRAVVAVHHLLKKHTEQCCHIVDNLVARLGDEDPHVVARVLATLPDVIQLCPESVSGLVPALVSIQRQILAHRLPDDMTYQGLQAPWTQLNIIKCLPELTLTQEDEASAKDVLIETLTQATSKDGSFVPPLRAALVSQSLTALMSLEGANEAGQARAMTYISCMLRSPSSDVKCLMHRHEGLQLLEVVLARHQLPLSSEQQAVVRASLEHPDTSIQRRALALLTTGAGEQDVQAVCGQLFRHAASADTHLRQWLLEQALALIGRFPTAVTPDWQLSALVKLLPLATEPGLSERILRSAQQILMHGRLQGETRGKLLGMLRQHGEAKKAPTCLLTLYIWTLGKFPDLDPERAQGTITKLVTLGTKEMVNLQILRNSKDRSPGLMRHIVQACSSAVLSPGYQPEDQIRTFLTQVREVSSTLRDPVTVLLNSLPHLESLRVCLAPPLPELDCTLSCMDQYVAEKLRAGECGVYQPQRAAQLLHPRARTLGENLSPLLPVLSTTSAMQTSQNSNQASQPSDDSWSGRSVSSPVEVARGPEAASRRFLWSKHGRAPSPEHRDTTPPLAEALSVSPQMSTVMLMSDDPLGDLLR